VIGLALAACLSTGAVIVVARALSRVKRAAPRDAESVASALRSVTDVVVLEASLRRAGPEHGEELAHAVASGLAPAAGAALVNETLHDVDGELAAGQDAARGAVRVAFFGGSLGAVVEVIGGMSGSSSVAIAAASFATGALGAVVCLELGRRVASRVTEARAAWDSIGAALGKRLAGAPAPPSS
jgi:hypothetical protein